MRVRLRLDGRLHDVQLEPDGDAWRATVDGVEVTLAAHANGDALAVDAAGTTHHVRPGDGTVEVDGMTAPYRIEGLEGVAGAGSGGGGDGRVRPPMTGKLLRVAVAAGDTVAAGDVLFVLEAMKMQNEVRSPLAGTVAAVHAAPGETLETDRVVLEITAD